MLDNDVVKWECLQLDEFLVERFYWRRSLRILQLNFRGPEVTGYAQ